MLHASWGLDYMASLSDVPEPWGFHVPKMVPSLGLKDVKMTRAGGGRARLHFCSGLCILVARLNFCKDVARPFCLGRCCCGTWSFGSLVLRPLVSGAVVYRHLRMLDVLRLPQSPESACSRSRSSQLSLLDEGRLGHANSHAQQKLRFAIFVAAVPFGSRARTGFCWFHVRRRDDALVKLADSGRHKVVSCHRLECCGAAMAAKKDR